MRSTYPLRNSSDHPTATETRRRPLYTSFLFSGSYGVVDPSCGGACIKMTVKHKPANYKAAAQSSWSRRLLELMDQQCNTAW